MGLPELLAIAMVVTLCGLLLAGYPVALTLGGVALLFALAGHGLGVMDLALLGALPQRVFGVMANEVLIAIPLFVFMGVMLERSGLAEDLLETMGRLFGGRPGGLAVAVVLVGVLLAAAKGIVGATVVTMGLIVLPTMLRYGYDPRLAAGTVAATATLAQIFPPATVLILLGDQISNAFTAAQLAKGSFSPLPVTVSDLFAGAIVPAAALVVLYLVFVVLVALLWPKSSPPIPPDPAAPRGGALARRLIEALLAPLALILIVLGSILGGVATPTESASIGAVGAIILAARRFAVRAFPAEVLMPVLHRTAHITSMIFVILIGATLFSLVFRGLRRRRHGASRAQRPAGRNGRRRARRHGRDVSSGLRHGCVRDHLRGGADRRAAAARDARRRSGLARRHDGAQPAGFLPASAAWADPVLSARRSPQGDHDGTHLCRRHPVRADSIRGAAGPVVCAGACDRRCRGALFWLEQLGQRKT